MNENSLNEDDFAFAALANAGAVADQLASDPDHALEVLSGGLALRSLHGASFEVNSPRYMLAGAVAGVSRASMCVRDPDGLWRLLAPGFARRLPEVRYKWGGRTLHSLQLEVVGTDDPSVSIHISSPLDAYKIPFLHVYVLRCDSLETYRTSVKPRLRAWVEELDQSPNGLERTEWLILYVPLLSHHEQQPGSNAKVELAAKKVFDKILADFGRAKNERCCRITLFQDSPADAQQGMAGDGEWGGLLRRVSKCLVSAFELRCRRFEDQVMKLEEQAGVPGWNYCN